MSQKAAPCYVSFSPGAANRGSLPLARTYNSLESHLEFLEVWEFPLRVVARRGISGCDIAFFLVCCFFQKKTFVCVFVCLFVDSKFRFRYDQRVAPSDVPTAKLSPRALVNGCTVGASFNVDLSTTCSLLWLPGGSKCGSQLGILHSEGQDPRHDRCSDQVLKASPGTALEWASRFASPKKGFAVVGYYVVVSLLSHPNAHITGEVHNMPGTLEICPMGAPEAIPKQRCEGWPKEPEESTRPSQPIWECKSNRSFGFKRTLGGVLTPGEDTDHKARRSREIRREVREELSKEGPRRDGQSAVATDCQRVGRNSRRGKRSLEESSCRQFRSAKPSETFTRLSCGQPQEGDREDQYQSKGSGCGMGKFHPTNETKVQGTTTGLLGDQGRVGKSTGRKVPSPERGSRRLTAKSFQGIRCSDRFGETGRGDRVPMGCRDGTSPGTKLRRSTWGGKSTVKEAQDGQMNADNFEEHGPFVKALQKFCQGIEQAYQALTHAHLMYAVYRDAWFFDDNESNETVCAPPLKAAHGRSENRISALYSSGVNSFEVLTGDGYNTELDDGKKWTQFEAVHGSSCNFPRCRPKRIGISDQPRCLYRTGVNSSANFGGMNYSIESNEEIFHGIRKEPYHRGDETASVFSPESYLMHMSWMMVGRFSVLGRETQMWMEHEIETYRMTGLILWNAGNDFNQWVMNRKIAILTMTIVVALCLLVIMVILVPTRRHFWAERHLQHVCKRRVSVRRKCCRPPSKRTHYFIGYLMLWNHFGVFAEQSWAPTDGEDWSQMEGILEQHRDSRHDHHVKEAMQDSAGVFPSVRREHSTELFTRMQQARWTEEAQWEHERRVAEERTRVTSQDEILAEMIGLTRHDGGRVRFFLYGIARRYLGLEKMMVQTRDMDDFVDIIVLIRQSWRLQDGDDLNIDYIHPQPTPEMSEGQDVVSLLCNLSPWEGLVPVLIITQTVFPNEETTFDPMAFRVERTLTCSDLQTLNGFLLLCRNNAECRCTYGMRSFDDILPVFPIEGDKYDLIARFDERWCESNEIEGHNGTVGADPGPQIQSGEVDENAIMQLDATAGALGEWSYGYILNEPEPVRTWLGSRPNDDIGRYLASLHCARRDTCLASNMFTKVVNPLPQDIREKRALAFVLAQVTEIPTWQVLTLVDFFFETLGDGQTGSLPLPMDGWREARLLDFQIDKHTLFTQLGLLPFCEAPGEECFVEVRGQLWGNDGSLFRLVHGDYVRVHAQNKHQEIPFLTQWHLALSGCPLAEFRTRLGRSSTREEESRRTNHTMDDQDDVNAMMQNPRRSQFYFVYPHGTGEPTVFELHGIELMRPLNALDRRIRRNDRDGALFDNYMSFVTPQPPDLVRLDAVGVLLYHDDEVPEGQARMMADVEFYNNIPSPSAMDPKPVEEWREVINIQKACTRRQFVETLGLESFCYKKGTACLVWHRGGLWHLQDQEPHVMEDGDYGIVKIRNNLPDTPISVQWEACHGPRQADQRRETSSESSSWQEEESHGETDDMNDGQVNMSLLQRSVKVARQSTSATFHAWLRLPPPGNGTTTPKTKRKVSFCERVKFAGEKKEKIDLTVTNSFIQSFCMMDIDNVKNRFFDDFMHDFRFESVEEDDYAHIHVGLQLIPFGNQVDLPIETEEERSVNSPEAGEQCGSYDGTRPNEHQRRMISLQELLPIEEMQYNTLIEDVINNIRRERHFQRILHNCWDQIDGLHETVKAKLSQQMNFSGGKMERIHIYTDGSCCKNGAAWAYVVEAEFWHPHKNETALIGFCGARMTTACLSSFYIGEEVIDAHEAENAAMWWAALWLLAWPPNQLPQIVFHGDCLTSLMASAAEWKLPQRNGHTNRIAERTRFLLQRLEADDAMIEYQHSKGHSGIVGNEAADSVAHAIAQGVLNIPERRTMWAKDLAQHKDLSTLWMNGKTSTIPTDDEILIKAPMPTSKETRKEIITDGDEPLGKGGTMREVKFNMATMNVFAALDKNACDFASRRNAIAQQCYLKDWTVVAIQESRLRQSIVKANEHYWMFTSAANSRGQYGVEIWISKSWQPGHRPLQARDFHVRETSSTFIVLTVDTDGFCADFVCCHAPQRTDDNKTHWWKTLKELLYGRTRRMRPMFLFGDFNARVGGEYAEGIGDLDPDDECENGGFLRDIIESFRLKAINTYRDIHVGPSATFQKHRLDYLLVSHEWAQLFECTWVDYTFDLLHQKDDHHPLIGRGGFMLQKAGKVQGPIKFDRHAACHPQAKETIKQIFREFKTPAWRTSCEDHVHKLTRHIQLRLQEHFPVVKKKRRWNPYLGENLWKLVLDRQEIMKWSRNSKWAIRNEIMRRCFGAWKNGMGERSNIHQMRMMLAVQEKAIMETGKRVRRAVKLDKSEYIQNELMKLEDAFRTKDIRRVFETIKTFRPSNPKARIKTPKPLPCLRVEGEWIESYQDWANAWHQHWAAVEYASLCLYNEHMDEMIDKKSKWACKIEDIKSAFPSLTAVENVILAAKKGKAPGQDQIPMEIYKAGGWLAAKEIFPIIAKELVHGVVPMAHKGSTAIPLYKSKGPMNERSSYRAISLQPTMGKIIARVWRPEISKVFDKISTPLQGGAKQGLGPIAHITRIRTLQQLARANGSSFCLIVMDIESAFYKTLRHLLVRREGEPLTDQFVAFLFKTFDLPPLLWDYFMENLEQMSILEEGKMSEPMRRVLQAGLEDSWARVPFAKQVLVARTGTKPGDPIADILFSCVMSRFLHKVQMRIANTFGEGWNAWPMTWVDDISLPFMSKAEDIVSNAKGVLAILTEEAQGMAMIPSLKQGKTEVMITYNGKQSRDFKRNLENGNRNLSYQTAWGRTYDIEVVDEIRYLGAIIDHQSNLAPEIRRATSAAFGAIKTMRRPVLQNERVLPHQRKGIVSVLALSKACYSIGSWPRLRQAEESLWSKRIMQIYRSTQKWDHTKTEHVSNLQVLASMDFTSPEILHEIAVLRVVTTLATWADELYMQPFFELDKIENAKSWTYFAVASFNNIGQTCNETPILCKNFTELFQWMREEQRVKEVRRWIKKYEAKQIHIQKQKWLSHKGTDQTDHPEANKDATEFVCPIFASCFLSRTALGVHKRVRHGIHATAAHFAPSTACFACGKLYHTRARVAQHLQYGTTDCLEKLMASCEPLTSQQVTDLNARDISARKETQLTGRRTASQKMSFLPSECTSLEEMTGLWNDQGGVCEFSPEELAEVKELEEWSMETDLLAYFEHFAATGESEDLLKVIDQRCAGIRSPRVLCSWMTSTERDFRSFAHEVDSPIDAIRSFVKIRANWLAPCLA